MRKISQTDLSKSLAALVLMDTKKNLAPLFLPACVKNFVEVKLKEKVADRSILDILKRKFPGYLINLQTIRNIKAKVMPNYVYSPNDKISLQLIINETPELFFHCDFDTNLFILSPGYKVNVENSSYFCIDSTHQTTFYGFYLTTILVIDDLNRGIPILHMITENENDSTLKILFEILKQEFKMPSNFTLISDDFAAYVGQCNNVFGNIFDHILCRWYVRKNLRLNLRKKSSGDNNKALGLIEIITKTREKAIYYHAKRDLKNATSEEFFDYFMKYYDSRREKWVPAFNSSRIFFNMHIESFHSLLKMHYFGKKRNKRADVLVYNLKKISADMREKMING